MLTHSIWALSYRVLHNCLHFSFQKNTVCCCLPVSECDAVTDDATPPCGSVCLSDLIDHQSSIVILHSNSQDRQPQTSQLYSVHGMALYVNLPCGPFYWMDATNFFLDIWNFYHARSLIVPMTSCTELWTCQYLILSVWKVFGESVMHMWAHFYHFSRYSTLRMVWVQVLEIWVVDYILHT